MINDFSIIQAVSNQMQNKTISTLQSNDSKFTHAKRNILANIEKTIDSNKKVIIDEYKEIIAGENKND